jgi:hypothetical protein
MQGIERTMKNLRTQEQWEAMRKAMENNERRDRDATLGMRRAAWDRAPSQQQKSRL